MSRPTVHDVARAAGVSLATVDRVLNARPGVRAATVDKVHKAMSDIGYSRDIAAANLARQRSYRFDFVLPEPTNAFLRGLHQAIDDTRSAFEAERVAVRIHAPRADDPHAVANTIMSLQETGVDGIAVMAAETPQVRDAMIRAEQSGAKTVAMISDLPSTGRAHFVGVDGIAAGRTAGDLMGRFIGRTEGRVLAVAGSMMVRDHLERRLGFDQVIGERFAHLETLPSLEGRDDAETVCRVVTQAVSKRDDIVGIYCFGGGASGLIKALDDLEFSRDIPVIAHELTPATRLGLRSGRLDAVIAQDVNHVVRSAIRVLRAEVDGRAIVVSEERIRIEIVLKENLI